MSAACAACGEVADDGARFCEACGEQLPGASLEPDPVPSGTDGAGADLGVGVGLDAGLGVPNGTAQMAAPPSGACPACGGADGFDVDGFCLACGVRSVRPRDRVELDLGWVAAVSDKGPRKVRNEDAFALQPLSGGDPGSADPDAGVVLAVCDGVSNVPRSDEASQGAADAAVAVLLDAGPAVPDGMVGRTMAGAAEAASTAVRSLAPSAVGGEPPSCTFLAARYTPAAGLAVAWMGDCRAYAIDAHGVRRLTTDHSWGSEAVRAGRLTQAEADRDDRSHAITRWLGADAPPDAGADLLRWAPDGDAVLVCCSDGAWNYFDAEQLGELVSLDAGTPAAVEPMATARRLTQHAIDGGGHDNITVVVARLAGVPGAVDPPPVLPADTAPPTDAATPMVGPTATEPT